MAGIAIARIDVMSASRTVLHPTDFSNASRAAFTTAMTLAQTTRATLTILHVIVPIVPLVPEQFLDTATWARLDRKAREWGYARLRQLAARARKRGLRVTTLLCEGDPSRHIVITARGCRAGFVVMGTHGRRGISRFLLGSVAERVVALAPCPVVTVRGK
jgi:nucleotide-binding universal stress UspA family protein